MATTLNRAKRKPIRLKAYAVVHRTTGRILRDWHGQLSMHTSSMYAAADCPAYGKVIRVNLYASEAKD